MTLGISAHRETFDLPSTDLSSTIFLLGREDAPQIAGLESQCFESSWNADMYRHVLAAERMPLEALMAGFETQGLPVELLVLGCMSAESLLGYISIRPLLVVQSAEIYNIAVQPALRGQGIGHALLQSALKALEYMGVKEISLEVRAGNTAAIALYEKNGFKPCGIRPRYYPNGEDAVLMERLQS